MQNMYLSMFSVVSKFYLDQVLTLDFKLFCAFGTCLLKGLLCYRCKCEFR